MPGARVPCLSEVTRSVVTAVLLLLSLPAVVTAMLLLLSMPAVVTGSTPRGAISTDGAWSWFSDPRALCVDGTVYTGWVTGDGDVEVATCDMSSGVVALRELRGGFQSDDHVNPAFYQTSDGRLTAFYSKHN
ncbi:MAG: hypothetical protein JXB46_01245, partial [Candidatus Eisenbacteria bacterium]|nr:hypothetical protein [Candidatus Eisenbacteria bacterium]